jgi:hypothetical protein
MLWTRGALGSRVDRGGVNKGCGGALLARGAPGAVRPRSSPVEAGEEEGDEVGQRGCSPEHGRWQRGTATVMKSGGGLSSMREQRRARGSSGEKGNRCGEAQECAPPFIGARGCRGGGGQE